MSNAIRVNFNYTIDKKGKNYCSLVLDWYYNLGYADISMPKYIPETLKKLSYQPKVHLQHTLYKNIPIQHSNKEQYVYINKILKLDLKETKRIQSMVSSFLYCTRLLDYTLLPAIN